MTPEIIAHRGGIWPDAPENTLESFMRARDFGLDWIETDVRITRDGVVYVFHDDDLTRLAGIDARIDELASADVDAVELIDGGRIPRLSAVLEEMPDTRLNIDAKDDRVLGGLIRTLTAHRAGDRIRLASFSSRRLERLRAAFPGTPSSAGEAEIAAFLFAPRLWLPRRHPSLDCLQVPERSGIVPVVTARTVARAHAAALAVHVWTVNDGADAVRLAGLGVDALITDDPPAIAAALKVRARSS